MSRVTRLHEELTYRAHHLSLIPSPDRLSGLLALLAYAFQHAHSRMWVPAILRILAREEVR